MIDGEIILADTDRNALDFEALQQRIHPAASRVKLLAEQTPASFVAFDLLAARRRRPHRGSRSPSGARGSSRRSPAPRRRSTSRRRPATWTPPGGGSTQFEGAGLDGLIAKPLDLTYQPDKRVMSKIKHERTADCVVAGYRVHKSGAGRDRLAAARPYDDRGVLASVGVIGAFPMATRKAAVRRAAAAGHRRSTGTRGTGPRRSRASAPRARTRQPVERRQGPVVRPAAAGAGRRGALRLHGGRAASGTPPSSSAGARTASPRPAPTTSSNARSTFRPRRRPHRYLTGPLRALTQETGSVHRSGLRTAPATCVPRYTAVSAANLGDVGRTLFAVT